MPVIEYKHGISTDRDSDIVTVSEQATSNVQVAIGVAPINLLDDPSSAVNTPILVTSRNGVKTSLGTCTNYKAYTLMQTTLASFQKFGVAPVIMINVLDPKKKEHVIAVAGKDYELTRGSTTIETEGILLDSIVVSNGETQGVLNTDYVATFDTNGYVTIAVAADGAFKDATSITVAYTMLNPEGVTPSDIIGGIDENGIRTGIELVDEIYSRFQVVPGILSAPKYSRDAAVTAALEAKAELAGDLTNAIAVIDLEAESTVKIDEVKDARNKLGAFTRWTAICWPKVIMGGVEIYASAAVAALLQYTCTNNNNIPASPDNKSALIDGLVLEGGKEVHFTQKQVNDYLNANGIVSFVYMGGWKCWGNNTAAYPDNMDPNNRFIKNVMISNYLENLFKTEYLSQIGDDASYKLIDSIVSDFNASLNALAPAYIAGAEVIFDKSENPLSEILEGHFRFHTRYADYTPTEWINNTFTWDSKILEKALEGGEES